jgi:NAD-dependent DNA ligase
MLNEAYTRVLAGKTIVFTGKLSQPRARLEAVARKLGAKPVGAISGKTSYLVVGEDAGNKKLSEAREYDVEIIKEAIWNDIVATLKS